MLKFTFLFCLIGMQTLYAQTKQDVNSNIDKVIVFTSGAQINRSAKTNISAGKTELIFKDIAPDIDQQSIQVKGDGKFTILSVAHQMNYLKQQEVTDEIKQLQNKREELNENILQQTTLLNVYKQEQALLEKNQSIGGSQVGVNTDNLKAAADFQRSRLTEIYTKQNEFNATIKKYNDALQQVTAQLAILNGKKEKPTSEIHVMVSAKETTTGDFNMSYYVQNAGWFATYDLRVKDVNSPVELYYKANVYQSSGEEWEEAHLTLSNGNPNESGAAPLVGPWRLYYPVAVSSYGYGGENDLNPFRGNQYTQSFLPDQVSGMIVDSKTNEPMAFATIVVSGTTVGAVADANGRFQIQMPAGANSFDVTYVGYKTKHVTDFSNANSMVIRMEETAMVLEEVAISRNMNIEGILLETGKGNKKINQDNAPETIMEYKPTTFTYDIKEPYTILNNGKVYTIDVQAMEITAEYEYFAAPKIDKDVFLTAKITDWQELNLLPGEANLFFEGAYLGKTILDVRMAKDTLSISLGRDKGIVIQRNKLKEFTQKQFIGSNKKETLGYEIVIRNNKQQAVNIVIKEQFPIATDNDMEVEKIAYSEGSIEEDSKIVTWKVTLQPKEEKKLQLVYSVKYPKNKTLLLE